jgi:hypothetical protein
VLDELMRDHRVVDQALRRLEELVDGLPEERDGRDVRTELDGLAALLEVQFRLRGAAAG